MLDFSTLKFYSRYVRDNLPACFYPIRIVTQRIHHIYDARNSDQIHMHRTRTWYAEKWVLTYLHIVLNSTPRVQLEKLLLTVSGVSPLMLENTSSINNRTFAPSRIATFVMIVNCRNMCNISLPACLILVVFIKPLGNGGSLSCI